jgi:hypothetical protein
MQWWRDAVEKAIQGLMVDGSGKAEMTARCVTVQIEETEQ